MKLGIEHKEKIYEKAEILKALGNPVRLCLLFKLVEEGSTNVSDIISCMDVSQSAVSQHLRKLKDMGIVESKREENRIYYSCTREDVRKIISCLKEDL